MRSIYSKDVNSSWSKTKKLILGRHISEDHWHEFVKEMKAAE